jgi:hypothetical protein
MAAIENKFLRRKKPASREYIAGSLLGLSEVHLQAFPELWALLQQAESMEWNLDLVMPVDNADRYALKNFGSFAQLYQELVEPWLGKYEDLKDTYQRYTSGEITREEGAEQLTARARGQQAAGDKDTGKVWPVGRPKKLPESGNLPQRKRAEKNGVSRDTQQKLDRLAQDFPALLDKVKRGKLSVNAAAIQAGFVRKPTSLEVIKRHWKRLAAAERRAFVVFLQQEGAL